MQLRKSILAFIVWSVFVVVFSGFGFANSPTNRVSGVLQMEIIEPYGIVPQQNRYFVQTWDGQNHRRTYFTTKSDKIDFSQFVNKEVTVLGSGDSNNFVVSQVVSKESDSRPLIEDIPSDAIVAPFTMPPSTLGTRTILFMLVHHGQTPTTSFVPAQIKEWGMTGDISAKNFVKTSSFDRFSFVGSIDPTGDVTPWLPLTASPDNCEQNMGNAWRMEADNLAEAQGFSKTAYKFRVVLFAPIPGCNLTAMAQVGIFGDSTGVVYATMQLPSSGQQSDLVDKLDTLVHELEHNLGQAEHSNGQQTENGPILTQRDNGDSLGSNRLVMNHLVNRMKFGWLTTAQIYPTISVRGQHRFLIQSPSRPSKGIGPNSPPVGGVIELRNLDGTLSNKLMVLETRTRSTYFDVFESDIASFVGGVAIRIVNRNLEASSTGTVLLDTTPLTPCCDDAALNPGRSFTVNQYGVTVSAAASMLNRVWVTVNLGDNYPVSQ